MELRRTMLGDAHTHGHSVPEADNVVGPVPHTKTLFLPLEAWHIVFSYMPVADLKAARLACKTWGQVGARYLFQPAFLLWPHRKDLERLATISQIPHLAIGIETLKFVTSAFGPSTRHYINWAVRAKTEIESAEEVAQAASELKNWRRARRAARQNYSDRKILHESISRLKNLHSLEVSLTAGPWQSPLLQQLWRERWSETQDREVMEIMNILAATKSASSNMLTLRLDGLHAKFLEQSVESLSKFSSVFLNLHTLHLVLDTYPGLWTDQRAGLGQLLRYAPALQDLRLRRDKLTWARDAPGQSFHLWSRCLGDHVWPGLRILHLDGFLSDEDDLFKLLEKHASTLEELHLFNIVLYRGSFRTLFTSIKQHLHLRKFAVGGVINAWYLDDEKWEFGKPSSPELHAEILEDFVLRDGTWPMPASNFEVNKKIPGWDTGLPEAEFGNLPYEGRHPWSVDLSYEDLKYASDVDSDTDE